MKLNIKEIKYIRQSLEFKAKYYEDRERYKNGIGIKKIEFINLKKGKI